MNNTKKSLHLAITVVTITALTGFGVFLFALNAEAGPGGYTFNLTSPTPPASSDTYTWVFDGTKPGSGTEISHLNLEGCWTEDDILTVNGSTSWNWDFINPPGGNKSLKFNGIDGDDKLPATITIVFNQVYPSIGSVTGWAKLGPTLTPFYAAGPSCETQEQDMAYVSGYKFEDVNHNGVWDAGEPPLNNWEICQETTHGQRQPLSECVLTGNGVWPDGYYEFIHYGSGIATLTETLQDGWTQTAPATGKYVVDIQNQITYANNDFGNYFPDPIPMSIVKTVDMVEAIHGDELMYTIEVTNSSGNDYCEGATLIITDDITDVLADAEASFAALSGSVATWTFEDVECGGTIFVYFTATVLDTALDGAVIENTAWVRDEGYNESVTSNTVETLISAPISPVLSIIKTVDKALVNPSDMVTYTVTVSNSGEGVAFDVILVDTLPAGLTFANNDGSNSGDTEKTWELGDLATGEDVTVTYDALVDSNAGPDIYDNVAVASAANYESVTANAVTEVRIPVVLGETAPALSIDKTVMQEFANPGSTITYTVEVTNTGDAVAYNALLEDTLPVGFVFVETGKRTHTWELGDLTPSETTTLTYDVMIDASIIEGNYVNTAITYADDVDKLSDEAVIEIRAVAVLGAEDLPTVLPTTGAGVLGLLAAGAVAFGISVLSRKRNR